MAAAQCSLGVARGVHLEYVAPGKWRLTGETNITDISRDDTGWLVQYEGTRLGHYRSVDAALAHAYSVSSDPRKRIS